MDLGDYQTELQTLLIDTAGQFFQLAELNVFINWARHRIAGLAECVRWLTPSGSGGLNTVANQEVYRFSAANAVIPSGQGLGSVLSVRMVTVSSGSFKPAWRQVAWTAQEAYFRALAATGTVAQPGIWAQYGQGASGSIYLYPIPSQAVPMEWDCTMLPIDLAASSDVEAIPAPWTDFVTLGALSRAYLAQRNVGAAQAVEKWFLESLGVGRREASGSVRVMHPYGGGPA